MAVKASIVIRTFNSERTLRELLKSVLAQRFDDYEIIVVDSGSTDGTLSILRDYPCVFVDCSDREFGYGSSLNAGCAVAKGKYIVSLSSHCLPLSDRWLGRLVSAMDADARVAGAWGPLLFQKGGGPGQEEGVELIGLEDFYRRPNRGLQNPNSIIRRELWEQHPFSEKIERCEDQEWAHYFLKRGYNTAVVRGAEALYKIPYGPYRFAEKTMRDFLVLNELFAFREKVSVSRLLRESARLVGAAVAGRRSPRVSALLVASLVGRLAADKTVMHGRLRQRLEEEPGSKSILLVRILAAHFGQYLSRIRRVAWVKSGEGPRGFGLVGMEGKTRFFLVGEMRSGTSWLSGTLNTHPEVFCKGEGSFFGRDQVTEEIPVYRAPTPSLYNALLNCEGFDTWRSFTWNAWGKEYSEEDMRDLTRLVIDYHLLRGSGASGKRIVGDKSPLHTDHVDEIFDFYPEARVLHIVRDGRDVAVSLMHHFWRLSKDRGGIFDLEPEELERRDAYLEDPAAFIESGDSIFMEERLRQMAVRWSRRVGKASRDGSKLFGPRFFQLRYEDLLAQPEESLKAVFGSLGARNDEDLVLRCVEKNRFEKLARRPKGSEDSGSFFRKGVVGDWRNVFTERDRSVYEEIAEDTLREMGYPLSRGPNRSSG